MKKFTLKDFNEIFSKPMISGVTGFGFFILYQDIGTSLFFNVFLSGFVSALMYKHMLK